jgi:hypothetical protein
VLWDRIEASRDLDSLDRLHGTISLKPRHAPGLFWLSSPRVGLLLLLDYMLGLLRLLSKWFWAKNRLGHSHTPGCGWQVPARCWQRRVGALQGRLMSRKAIRRHHSEWRPCTACHVR